MRLHTQTTKFLYRLASFIVIDIKGKIRPVLLSLILREAVETWKQVLSRWHTQHFNAVYQIPSLWMAMIVCTLLSHLSLTSDSVHHLLCMFHLFYVSLKKKLIPILQAMGFGNGSQWALFRKGLSMCREAASKCQFDEFWATLLMEWIPMNRHGNKARKYLHQYVYATRRQWKTSFFRMPLR